MLVSAAGQGQPIEATYPKVENLADAAFATNGNMASASLSISRMHGLFDSRRFRVGYGVRVTGAFAGTIDYRTAPSNITIGKESLLGLFSERKEANLDTLQVNKTQIVAFNAALYLAYALTPKWEIGFDIDLLGFSLGGEQNGRFQANSPGGSQFHNTVQIATPTRLNALFGHDSDYGTLYSELYVLYRLNPRLSARLGAAFLVTEYTTRQRLTFDNNRFRADELMVLVAVSYHLP